MNPCKLHGERDCAICQHGPGQCDFGDCQDTATHVIIRPYERRPFCTRHATEPVWAFARRGARVELLEVSRGI